MTTAQGIAVLVGVTVLALFAMWLGWARRRVRTGALVPDLPVVPAADELGLPTAEVPVMYVSTTLAGRWLERVVAHGLGARSSAVVSVYPRGVLIRRQGAPDVFISAEALYGVRLVDGFGGKVVGGRRLVVLGWQHWATNVDTGVLPRSAAGRERLVTALTPLYGPGPRPEEEPA